MPAPYDYTINIPQPPAQNFLQSLLGIQQLKGLQQQQELSQQQAGIQQQQAQFAQQMQPLQLQTEQARLGQIGQATATGAEALRQGKITFEQAQQDRVRGMEQQAVAQAQQQELFGKLGALPADAPMSDIVPIANQLALLKPEVAKQVMSNFTALPEEIQKASKTVLVTATTQLEAGDVDGAKKTYNTFEQAVRNSAGKNPQLLAVADGIKAQGMILDANPNAGKLSALQMLGAIDTKTLDSIVGLQKEETEAPLKVAQTQLAEADVRLKELKASGNLDAEQRMQEEGKMRSEFLANPYLRTFPVRKDAYNTIINAEKTPIGDSAKVVSFIKLQDPQSVVSVTEKGQITSTTPIASLQSLIQKFTNDGILDGKTRLDIDSQSKNIFNTAKSEYEKVQKNTTAIAKRYGLNPDNIISVYDTELQQPAVAPSYTPPTGVTIKSVR
jgi:hypothetical protein